MNQEIIASKKKKWYKKKWFYFLVALGLVVFIVVSGQVKKANRGPEYEFAVVERGTLTQTVDATGNVSSANELDLRFESAGRIGAIYKRTGDDVKKGEAILDLQLGSLSAAVAQAAANVRKAQADLDRELAGNTFEYIAGMQAKFDKAKADLAQIEASSADSVSDAEAALEDAENSLERSEGGDDSQIVQNAYDDMVTLLASAQDTLTDGLTAADNILGIDNTLSNNSFESYLSLKDTTRLYNANNKYLAARSAKIDTDTAVNGLTTASINEKVDYAADIAEEGFISMKNLLFEVSGVLENTAPIGTLSQSDLDAHKTNIQTARASVSADYISLINQKQAVETAKNSYNTSLIAYNKAVADLQNTKNRSVADVAAYRALVDQAQADLNDAKNPPRDVDTAGYRASVSSAQAGLSQAVANRNKARISAPLDGVIGKIEGKIGEYVAATDVVVKLVSPHYEIKVDIPETDIIKVSLGDEASIHLDAYGDEISFTGVVIEIEQGETVIQDVVYYAVTLSLEDSEEYQILNGMTSDVLFYTEDKEDVLYLPQRAVRTNDQGKYVRVLKDGAVEEVLVKTGLRGDGGFVEILEGIEEGVEVVLSVVNGE